MFLFFNLNILFITTAILQSKYDSAIHLVMAGGYDERVLENIKQIEYQKTMAEIKNKMPLYM